MDQVMKALPPAVAVLVVVVVLFVAHRLLERGRAAAAGHRFRNQVIMTVLTAVAVLVVIMVLPIGDATRGQLLTLIGILLSAAIALSSTTILGNAMAGIMLRAVRSFGTGDFIRCGEHFGRVSERGLFHTEIQTEDRDLTTLPNLYLVTHPVTTVRSSGTIVSATVSLGYDVQRSEIETLLIDAARRAELREPFVQILDLGDFSVTYRIAGLLAEVKQILSVRSRLRGCVMDALHEAGVEIVSPRFMNTRELERDRVFVPEVVVPSSVAPRATKPEDVVFDKAEEAESLESLRAGHAELREQIASLEKRKGQAGDASERKGLEAELTRLRSRGERLDQLIAARQQQVDEED